MKYLVDKYKERKDWNRNQCLSMPTLDKLKIGKRQILSRLFEGPNKFRQSSASRP